MSRSFRKIPERYDGKYEPEFLARWTKGLVDAPKRAVLKGGLEIRDEIWSPEAKKFAKRLRTRHERRQNRKAG